MSDAVRYTEALERQLALARFVCSDAGRRYRQEVFKSTSRAPELSLEMGQPFYWAPRICDMLSETAPGLPDVTFQPELLPCMFGFWWFANPLPLPPVRFKDGQLFGDRLAAISWCPIYWAEGDPSQRMVPVTGGEPEKVDAVVIDFYGPAQSKLIPLATWQWQAGELITEALRRPQDDNEPPRPLRVLRMQYFAAALLFLSQRILHTANHVAARSTRRRLVRDGVQTPPLIRVVELRERVVQASKPENHEPVEWSCQWVVGGHWREQPCGPKGAERRPQWILPYVKGPADKPLKPPSAKVFAVVR